MWLTRGWNSFSVRTPLVAHTAARFGRGQRDDERRTAGAGRWGQRSRVQPTVELPNIESDLGTSREGLANSRGFISTRPRRSSMIPLLPDRGHESPRSRGQAGV